MPRSVPTTLSSTLAMIALVANHASAQGPGRAEAFERFVRPILIKNCRTCHSGKTPSGGIPLDRHASAPGASARIARAVESGRMPPGSPLANADRTALAAWARAGGRWPSNPGSAPGPHWAFAPLAVDPRSKHESDASRTIDRIVDAELKRTGRLPAPRADRTTLIRRATFDLAGLPPAPDDVDAFLSDASPTAWQRVVDRLLSSRAHGEKMARRWLDVVRYADTAGENSDHPLPHAWRFRNWVIDAFANDLPYDRFVRSQLAGDLLPPDQTAGSRSAGIVATGFLALARRFGHDIDQDIHLTFEDAIDTTGKAFLGLGLGCARCHDHKFDPVSQRDYYALYGIMASSRFSFPGCEPKQLPRDLIPLLDANELARARVAAERQREAVRTAKEVYASAERTALAPFSRARSSAVSLVDEGQVVDATPGVKHVGVVELNVGQALLLEISPKANHGADTTRVAWSFTDESGKRIGSSDDLIDQLPSRHPVLDGNQRGSWLLLDLRDAPALLTERCDHLSDRTELRGWRSGDTPSIFANRSLRPVDVWTRLSPRTLFAHPGATGPVGLAWIAPKQLRVKFALTLEDVHPGGDSISFRVLKTDSIDGPSIRSVLESANRQAVETTAFVEPVAFGVVDGKPMDAPVHRKGDPADPGATVPRGLPQVLGGISVRGDGSGRADLANELTGRNSALLARVWVNRLWQMAFGAGLVNTPNDFGVRGAPPISQPLLDTLAHQLIRSGWSTRSVLRAIFLSETYKRMAGDSARSPGGFAAHSRRRLDADELRDALLMVSGELDRSPGEAHPFPPESTWSFTQHAPFAAEYATNRRGIYLMQKRNRRSQFATLFDGPDPNASTAVRDHTTVPTQALWFMNNTDLDRHASALASLVEQVPAAKRNDWLHRRLYGRRATAAEHNDFRSFVSNAESGSASILLTRWIRLLLCSNEFVHVD